MYLIESEDKGTHTDIVIFGRDSEGKKYTNRVSNFRPYFYVLETDPVPDDSRITEVISGFASINKEPVKKVFLKTSKDVPEVRERFTKYYEADIMFSNRYIIDELGEVPTYPLNINYIDIETDMNEEFPDSENADYPISCISILDSFSDNHTTLFYKSDEIKKDFNFSEEVLVFKTEEELLGNFINLIVNNDPDIITGWNIDGFDLPYIIKRMQKLGLNPNKLSPLNHTRIDEKWTEVTIKGRIVLDMLKSYKHFRGISNQGNAESYSLDAISEEILEDKKIEHGLSFHDLWVLEPELLIKYNRHDNELVKRINDKTNVIEYFNNIRAKACSQFKNVFYESILIDGLLLRYSKDKMVLPSNPKDVSGKKFSGAYVLEPIPGIYKNVIVTDVQSMYPNIIKTFNISYETFNPNGKINIEPGIAFDTEIGIVPIVVEQLETERKNYKNLMEANKGTDKEKMYDYMQYAVKVLMNSFFGYLGYVKSRLYKKEVANAITTMGRKIIHWTKSVLENKGYQVIYSDTDSTFFLSKKSSLFEIMQEGVALTDIINESYTHFAKNSGCTRNTLNMEFEKIFKIVLFSFKKGDDDIGAKKRYAYIPLWLGGKSIKGESVSYVGFESKRSDSPRISRDIQRKVIEMVLKEKSYDEIVSFLRDIDKKIRNKEVDEVLYSFPKGITKKLSDYGLEIINKQGKKFKSGIPPVVVGALYSNKYLGTRYSKGSKPKWIYVKGVPSGYPKTHVITFIDKIPEGFVPDFDLVMERILRMKLEAIFKSVGWDFPNINVNTKTLDTWGL